MYSHMMVGSNDLDRSKKFYDAIFTATGGREGKIDPKGRLGAEARMFADNFKTNFADAEANVVAAGPLV